MGTRSSASRPSELGARRWVCAATLATVSLLGFTGVSTAEPSEFAGTFSRSASAAHTAATNDDGGPLSPRELRSLTDRYLFEISLPEFAETRQRTPYAEQLEWDSDHCTLSPNKPFGYSFENSCDRHDFGYRNYRRQDRFTEAHRKRIDDQFRTDMRAQCKGVPPCLATSELYYLAVRQFGGVAASTGDAIEQAKNNPEFARALAQVK